MSTKNSFYLLVLILVAMVVFGVSCDPSPKQVFKQCGVASNDIQLSCDTEQQTAKGAHVFSKGGVTPAILINVQTGLDTAIENARLSGYTDRLNSDFYDIYIPVTPCEPSPEQRVPSFVIWDDPPTNDSYDGTIFDYYNPDGKETDPIRISNGYVWKRDGKARIYVAERVLNLGTPTSTTQRGAMIVCADIAENGSNNGAEHILAANHNDKNRPDDPYWYYWATAVHTLRFHPFLPQTTDNIYSFDGGTRIPSGTITKVAR